MTPVPIHFVLSPSATPPACEVYAGAGILAASGAHLRRLLPHARRALVITNETVAHLYADTVCAGLSSAGFEVHTALVQDGEQWKSLESATRLFDAALDVRLDRGDAIVSLGGGVITDLAGFVAATFKRGLSLAHCPTTVLAQVDASIGGKTGVNLPRGKNLVGAFHQPALIMADVDTLRTLPEREVRAGIAEIVKCGMIADAELFAWCESGSADPARPADLSLAIGRAMRIKASIVERDEREAGERAHLNFGHTVGHAIEAATGYSRYLHGEAVAIGMAFAARLGVRVGVTGHEVVDRLESALTRLGLPVTAAGVSARDILDKMQYDKKIKAGEGYFVLTPQIGSVSVAARVPDEAIAASLADILR